MLALLAGVVSPPAHAAASRPGTRIGSLDLPLTFPLFAGRDVVFVQTGCRTRRGLGVARLVRRRPRCLRVLPTRAGVGADPVVQ